MVVVGAKGKSWMVVGSVADPNLNRVNRYLSYINRYLSFINRHLSFITRYLHVSIANFPKQTIRHNAEV